MQSPLPMKQFENRVMRAYPLPVGGWITLILLSLIILFPLAGCGKVYEVRERELRIRYVNLGIIFEFMINRDPEAKNLKRQMNELFVKIKDAEEKLQGESDGEKRINLKKNLDVSRSELRKIKEKEDYFKRKFLNRIDKAISTLSKDMHLDFVLNMGDALIFSQKEYDITEDVIREIIKLEKRRDPVSR